MLPRRPRPRTEGTDAPVQDKPGYAGANRKPRPRPGKKQRAGRRTERMAGAALAAGLVQSTHGLEEKVMSRNSDLVVDRRHLGIQDEVTVGEP